MKKLLFPAFWLWGVCALAQTEIDSAKYQRQLLDSLFLEEFEGNSKQKPKILHAEPLYIDLIRDLGARKGEKEWNVGIGMHNKRDYDEFHTLIEYEWAPIDRLGFEVELPLNIYSMGNKELGSPIPSNRLESLKLATQWTFAVSEKQNASFALGYIHEFELVDLNKISSGNLFKGNIYNPFLIAAKRWGTNYHTLIYTGPKVEKEFDQKAEFTYEINYNLHYMVSGTRNFVGLEVNQEMISNSNKITLRPQMRVGLAENLMVGIVSSIPINQPNAGLGSFVRLIYEPGFRSMH
jgi:hypothetical protein